MNSKSSSSRLRSNSRLSYGLRNATRPLAVLLERGDRLGIDAELPRAALDDRGLARRLAHAVPPPVRLRDAGGLQHPLFEQTRRLFLVVLGKVGRIHPLGEIPSSVPALATDDRDLALTQQEIEHDRHLVRAAPAVGGPAHLSGVGDVGGEQRPLGLEPGEDVARGTGRSRRATPSSLSRSGHRRIAGSMSGQQAHRPEGAVELEEQPVELDGLLQLPGLVRPADARPQHGVLARRDRGGRVDLDVAQLLGHLDDIARAPASSSCARTMMRRA